MGGRCNLPALGSFQSTENGHGGANLHNGARRAGTSGGVGDGRFDPRLSVGLSDYMIAIIAKLRELAPYAALELILPGGSVMAVFCGFIGGKRELRICPRRISFIESER